MAYTILTGVLLIPTLLVLATLRQMAEPTAREVMAPAKAQKR